MYGTIHKNQGYQQLSGESSSEQAKGAPDGPASAGAADPERRKRIYSHCHVQDTESRPQGVDKSARRRLIAASVVCLVFMIGEVIGGVMSNSLAIATDAAHLLTDFASFMISLCAIWLSTRPASRKMSFGWYRAEVIGALLSVLMIWLVTGLLVYLAVERLRTGDFEINSLIMVATASAGLLVNIVMALALSCDGHGHSHGFHSHGHSHGHSHSHAHNNQTTENNPAQSSQNQNQNRNLNQSNHQTSSENHSHHQPAPELLDAESIGLASLQDLNDGSQAGLQAGSAAPRERGRGASNINVRAAFVHVVGDFLQSLGVLIAALVIHFEPSYAIVDPICTFVFSIIVLVTTINIIRDAINVLMEGAPAGINFIEVREKLQALPGVLRVHNLRIWSLSLDKIAMSTHLVIDNGRSPSEVLKVATNVLNSSYNFFEVTIQVEEFKDDMRNCEHCLDEVEDEPAGPTTVLVAPH